MSETTPNVAQTPQNADFDVVKSRHWLRWAVLVGLAATLFSGQAQAEHWMFQPSYYSHAVAPQNRPLPSTRSSYRVPSVGNNPGFSVRGETRINFLRFRNGSSTDYRIQYRTNVDFDP